MPYTISGRPVQVAEEPRNMNGPMFVPLRPIIEAIGGQAGWDNDSKSATASFRGITARVFPNSTSVAAEGGALDTKQMSVPAFMTDGHTWVPLEFFEVFGITAIGDGATNTVNVNV